jgi:hypothetical protein
MPHPYHGHTTNPQLTAKINLVYVALGLVRDTLNAPERGERVELTTG